MREEGQMAAHSVTGNVPGLNSLLEDGRMKSANELLDKPGFLKAAKSTVTRPVSEEYTVRSDETKSSYTSKIVKRNVYRNIDK